MNNEFGFKTGLIKENDLSVLHDMLIIEAGNDYQSSRRLQPLQVPDLIFKYFPEFRSGMVLFQKRREYINLRPVAICYGYRQLSTSPFYLENSPLENTKPGTEYVK